MRIEDEIQKLLRKKGIRFSSSKFVGDLGEYYFKSNIENKIFETLYQSKTSNDKSDFTGILKDDFRTKYSLPKEVQIGVKTRKFQKGTPQLFGLDKNKFDILAFVALNKDYSCSYIGLIKKEMVFPDKQKRIRFKNNLKFWPESDYVEF
ncbi:MAG: hypothetical protein JJ971_11855 [Balneolaceae bacterium]|nr:hypothetical protein [Balneolaceae bacterium]MBO6547455.1 hypothetical protein [Balneolaceae bacterium]MBO6647598.1 hypothetical protein [Balneolaceae bacterium]